jgi:beta-phosphoglucomutase
LVKAIIWDMDGVVADTGEAHFAAWQGLFAERGATITWEQFASTFGMANPPILRQWLGEGTSPALIRELGNYKEELFRRSVRGRVRLLPGVVDWLKRGQARGYRQVIASSAEMANIVAVVEELQIGNYFEALVAGAFLPRSKPDPEIFLNAAASVGAGPADSLVIEDGIVGVEAARRAGMRCIAVTTTHPAEKLAGADLVVPDLTVLDAEAFERLLSK